MDSIGDVICHNLLSSSIPQAQIHWFAIYHNTGRVVVKDSGDVFSKKCIGCTTDQYGRQVLRTYSCVSHYHTPDGLHLGGSLGLCGSGHRLR